MKDQKHNTETSCAAPNYRRLLYALELLGQAYEVKIETLLRLPLFFEEALDESASKKEIRGVTAFSTSVYRHAQMFRALLSRFGARIDDDILLETQQEPKDPVGSTFFQEQFCMQISTEFLHALSEWPQSSLRSWAHEQVTKIVQETVLNCSFLETAFLTQKRGYQDLLAGRFSVSRVSS